jgi:3-hydroxybutyrate dehydrogenase
VRTQMAEAHTEHEAKERGLTVEEIWAERAADYPAGRVVDVDEVAATIAFLASEEASGVNGEAITVALGSLW